MAIMNHSNPIFLKVNYSADGRENQCLRAFSAKISLTASDPGYKNNGTGILTRHPDPLYRYDSFDSLSADFISSC
jgi:hypothetical protein